MNETQRPIVYRIVRAVQDEEISRKEALLQMQLQAGVPTGSAGILISVFDHMRRGVVYKRALSAPDTDYFFQRIQNDAGLEGLKSALDAFGLHIAYREGMGVGQRKNREVLDRYLALLRHLEVSAASISPSLDEIHQAFEERVKRALQDLPANRRMRLQGAPRLPERVSRSVTLFLRNPDVVAEVLVRARGVCDACKKSAPFVRRSDGTPYLEVHHKTPLADGGEDTVDNAMALCPNCHRQEHFGIPNG